MRTLLNVIWLLLCGIGLAIGYALAGIICCVLIVTIPLGLASFRIADFTLWPFGRQLMKRADSGVASTLGNIIWIIVAGWWLALAHITTAIALAVTIIGIPLALANLKLIPVALLPLGRVIVPIGAGAGPGEHRRERRLRDRIAALGLGLLRLTEHVIDGIGRWGTWAVAGT